MIRGKIEKMAPDLTVVCGDITHFGTPREARETIDSLPGLVLAVPGNCDPSGVELGVAESHGVDLHGNTYEFDGIKFAGFGGAGKMFGTIREYDEEFLGENIKRIIQGADVLVLHGPPYGINDLSQSGHAGSREILEAVQAHKPMLVLSGHIHECHGIVREDGITYINPGAARDGRSAYLEIEVATREIRDGSIEMMIDS
jgi:Icc-related predicted phosphoesterase